MELAGEAEKLAKKLHPRDEEASERHAVDVFLGVLDRTLAAEVQKLGHKTMEDVVAAARRIEKILNEQTDTKMERLVNTMQEQIRLLKKDLKEANEQITAHRTAAPSVAAMAAVSAPPTATASAAQPPPAAPARHIYLDYSEEPPFYRPPRRQMDRHPPVASFAAKKGTSCPTVLPVPSCNVSFTSKHEPALVLRLEDKYWSCQPPRTTPTPTLTCI